jgi:hypothetical protein
MGTNRSVIGGSVRLACVTLVFCIAVGSITSACGSADAPTEPSAPGPSRYDGQWTGTTSQGRAIRFSVSTDQKVTTITIGYAFGNCSGENTFSNLSLDVGYPSLPGRLPSTGPGPGFGYGSGPPDGPNYTQVYGWFSSSTTSTGSVAFGDFQGCGNAGGIWTATKR